MKKAAPQERVGQLFFVVRGDEHDRTVLGLDQFVRLVDVELHAVELAQQVVGEFDVGLVDFVDQQHHRLVRGERLPQSALDDVVADVVHARVPQLGIPETGHGVVFVQALLRLGGGLDVPLVDGQAERLGHFLGQHGLAGSGLALDQERALQRDGGVDGEGQVVGRDVVVGTVETHGNTLR